VARDLGALFDPRSVAVVGASNDPVKWGYGLAQGALRGAGRRSVFLVNKNGGTILGQPAHRSLGDLPAPAELVVVAVPEPAFEETVDAALAAGARAIVGVTAGLGEMGEAGQARERAVVERVRQAGAVLLGPNCLGVFDAAAELDIGWSELPSGPIGLLSQSGNLALELALLAADYGLGFSRFASLGNQADLEVADLVGALAGHDPTRVVALYVEDFRDGRAFAAACHAAAGAGKPVVLLTAGRSDASARAARSHTGALASELAAVEAACRAAGIELVQTPRELVDLAQALLARDLPQGRRLGVFGDGGGHGVIAADLGSTAGFEVPALGNRLAGELAAVLGPTAVTRNPVDLAGGGEKDFASFERVARLLLSSGEVDAAILTGYFGGYAEYGPAYEAREREVARGMARAAAESGRPLLAQTMYPRGPAAAALRDDGVPVYGDIGAAIGNLARLASRAERRPLGVPALPAPAQPVTGAAGYFEARALLAAEGLSFVEARRVGTRAETLAAAGELGYPVVLKALGLLHKSDAGGVAVGIATEEELEQLFADIATRLSPPSYSIERTAPVASGVELLVGCRRDARFGPVALAGLGGVHAEVLRDVAVALAPIGSAQAEELLRSLRGAPLLLGVRGRPALALDQAAEALAAVSRVAAAHAEIAEIEVNPLLVTVDGAVGLDARIVLDEEGESHAR
jgi:acyl-CoA synthetase (NDP forming)